MLLYLIRHGQTDHDLAGKRQSPDSPLGEYGLKQAEAVAKRFHLKKLDHLYSSDWPRAYQTAQKISATTGLKIKIHPHIHEMRKSSILNELDKTSDLHQQYLDEMRSHLGDFDWKFNGEGESLNELLTRAQKVIKYLIRKHPGDTIAVVSHGTFSAALVSLMILGFDYHPESFLKLFNGTRIHNTGITSLEYTPELKRWRLTCFNDHGHLEDEI